LQRLRLVCLLAAVFAAFGTSAASARPNVALKLEGDVVQHDSKGAEQLIPVADGTGLKPGETIRYVIVASNAGPDAATSLVPQAKIPEGTAYEPGSASTTSPLRVEFSIDGGKTWAVKPLVRVQTANGVVEKPADPSLYTSLRWIGAKALQPKTSVSYSYQVRIK
jgi:uncharacterized repeat protein (TIGR01451 family)